MTIMAPPAVHLVWDLAVEPPTLGGALVLRQEGERLAVERGAHEVVVHLTGYDLVVPPERLITAVFKSSFFSFRTTREPAEVETWPTAEVRKGTGFSYFSFARLKQLCPTPQDAPHLIWEHAVMQRARAIRALYAGKLICVHLRYTRPFLVEESSADGLAWNAVLHRNARAGVLEFMLLSDDDVPPGLQLAPGIYRASDRGIDLATQLALIAHADGFLGMASGLCTAANLSGTPHVIFKHPAHHAEQMLREFGETDRFPFATEKQRLWRKIADEETIEEALHLILS